MRAKKREARSLYSFRLRSIVAVSVALTLLASVAPVSATTIYSLPAGYSQNQAYTGTLGMDFTVNSGSSVTIDALGALSDGASTITVAIFNVSTDAIVAGAQTNVSSAGAYAFTAITPVTLTPGTYQIAAWGYNGNNQDYNPAEPSGVGQLSFNTLNGALTADGAYYNNVAGQIGNTFDPG